MTVIVLQKAPDYLRGELTRYLYEISNGVYAGEINAKIRELLWNKIEKTKNISASLIYPSKSEQKFAFRSIGDNRFAMQEIDGILCAAKERLLNHRLFLAKPQQTTQKYLLCHLMETAEVAKVLITAGILKDIPARLADELQISCATAINYILFLCAAHDIGKYHQAFQTKICNDKLDDFGLLTTEIGSRYDSFRHEEESGRLIFEYLLSHDITNQDWLAELSSQVLKVHHQGKTHTTYEPMKPAAEDIAIEILDKLYQLYPFQVITNQTNPDRNGIGIILTGVLIISDWISSNTSASAVFDERKPEDFSSITAYQAYLHAQAEKLVAPNAMLHLSMRNRYADVYQSEEPYKTLFGITTPRPMQNTVLDMCKNMNNTGSHLIIIESACGSGKTEASFLASLFIGKDKSGFYNGMPTGATAEAIYSRTDNFLQRGDFPDTKLMTGNAWLHFDNDKDKSAWQNNARQKLLYPAAVGTVDQIITSWQAVKYGAIRAAAITNKVIILDEIHAYDEYMMEEIKGLLQFCGWFGIPVVALSATLPHRMKVDMIKAYGNLKKGGKFTLNNKKQTLSRTIACSNAYPLVTDVRYDYHTKQLDINEHATEDTNPKRYKYVLLPHLTSDVKTIVEMALHKVRKGGCCLVVTNTVSRTQEAYQYLEENREKYDYHGEIVNLHAKCPDDMKNKKTENLIRELGPDRSNRPEQCIVFATQIVEQSMDIDVDFLITELAPIDLLIQRIGRYRRHGDAGTIRERIHDEDDIIILVPEEGTEEPSYGASGVIYSHTNLKLTEQTLRKYNGIIRTPEDTREIVDDVYENEEYQYNNRKAFKGKHILLDSPYSKTFDIYEREYGIAGTLYEEAATRPSEYQTYKIALVPAELYDKLAKCAETKDYLPLTEQRTIYRKYVVTVPWWDIAQYQNGEYRFYQDALTGLPGYLDNIRIYSADSIDSTHPMRIDPVLGFTTR